MARHFLRLYLLIVATLIVASWGQGQLLHYYGGGETSADRAPAATLRVVDQELRGLPSGQWRGAVAQLARATGVDLELFNSAEVAGRGTLSRLARGEVTYMQGTAGQAWALRQLSPDYVLALRSPDAEARRSALEWALTVLFYAAIALVIMIWLWPLSRDLRTLEKAAAGYGNRNWRFSAAIGPHSQIFPLAETFRRMAARIDGLIASHKDMSNAVSHEIRTPLARMKFEIELAQQAASLADVRKLLDNIKGDIAAIDALVSATLAYAILERADMVPNIAAHDLTTLIPAIADDVRRDARSDLRISAAVQQDADSVVCDMHLLETVLRNLLYNACRYARHAIEVRFRAQQGMNELLVDDDGPGIPEADRARVFDSFVRLEQGEAARGGFGLGLAIVKRAAEWHNGAVTVSQSPLGGARFCVSWPASLAAQ